MRFLKAGMSVAVAGVILSGCVVAGPGGAPPVQQTPTFAEGSWVQGDVANYRFGSGSFVGNAQDTGNLLSNGSYRYTGPNQVNISGTSAIRGTSFSANCLAVNRGAAMNCTTQSGAQFTLLRA